MATKAAVANTVRGPYIAIAAGLLILGFAVAFMHLPHVSQTQEFRPAKEGDPILGRSIWSYRHTVLGRGRHLPLCRRRGGTGIDRGELLQDAGRGQRRRPHRSCVSLYWVRRTGLVRLLGSWILTKIKSGKLLGIFGFAAALFVLISMFTSGQVAIWTLVICGFFNSIMFPNIFALGIPGLGPMTSKGSGLIMTAVVGGAIVPLAMGAAADKFGIQHAFVIPLICYLFIAYYGLWGSKPTRTVTA